MSRIVSALYGALAYLVFLGIRMRLQERDLIELFGDEYSDYRTQVSMLFPWPGSVVAGALPRRIQPRRR